MLELRKRRKRNKPRILIVTPEITYLPNGMGNMANRMSAKAGGLADVSSSLVAALYDLGADVHVALPHYRRMFNIDAANLISDEIRAYMSKLSRARIHLAEDRCFYYRDSVYGNDEWTNINVALAFQREVINNIIPSVDPDLIHCNDWMTGLIPAVAKRWNIPSLFTVHNIHTYKLTLQRIEDAGIDAADFWKYLYFEWPPYNYETARATNPIDLLASGVFASHYINTVSPTFLQEIADGQHSFVPGNIRHEITQKLKNSCAVGILNAPDPSNNPAIDTFIEKKYTPETHIEGRAINKHALQEKSGLNIDPAAPILFWPSRLDPVQKGCQLFADILFKVVDKYWKDGLQIAIVANGAYQNVFHKIVWQHDFHGRVAVCDFSEPLSRLGYAGSDFMLIPSLFEPCGLPQMVSSIYGSLPIARNTGGLHDTVTHLDIEKQTGNGFVFETYDSDGLFWAIDQAMQFYKLPDDVKNEHISRIMNESIKRFSHNETAKHYFDIYETMLARPIVQDF
jgi:starch synthase